jgi:RNA polymerase sigma-70 factor (ECF subfamily)
MDLVQDTSERALRSCPPELEHEALRAWLVTTLRNLFMDGRRASRRRRTASLPDEMIMQEADAPTGDSPPLWRLVDDQAVERCIETLHPRLREVYLMRAKRGLTLKQIATLLNLPLGTVGTRLFRARRHLRGKLERSIERSALQDDRTAGGGPQRVVRVSAALGPREHSSAPRANARRRAHRAIEIGGCSASQD